jgi:ribose/xylose/arabinose/galactoside ABC-type transport system permease subunit
MNATDNASQPQSTPTAGALGRAFKLLAPFIGLIVVYGIFYFLAKGKSFTTLYNTKSILQQAVIIGTAALGMTLIIISAGIDLSAGSMVALTTVVTALVLKHGANADGQISALLPIWAALAGIMAAGACGFLNGFMISVFGIVPFIVTLGMMQIARGVAKGIAGQTTVIAPNTWLAKFMIIEPVPGAWWSFAPGVWLMLGLMLFFWVMLNYTTFGRHVYAVGSNASTARLCGINVGINRLLVYAISGLLTGVSGVLSFSCLSMGDPTLAVGLELDIIAAVVIGGGSFNGGEGSVVGSVIGAVIIAILRNGCVQIGLDNYVQNILIGSIIIIAVGVDQLKHRRAA